MDIVILAHFCIDFSDTDNGRFNYIARILSKKHSVEIITSDFYHTNKCYRGQLPNQSYKITLIHEPYYPKNVCLRRFFSHHVWGKNVEKYLNQREKPDVIYTAVPSLTGPLAAANYCLKNDVRFIIDIQDLWPEAFQMVIPVPVIRRMMFLPFTIMANRIYRSADAIFAVSHTYVERALSVSTKCIIGHPVFLGTELKTYDDNSKNNPILHKNSGELWLAYCGSLANSYDLICVFDALTSINAKGIRAPKFIVMGSGANQEEFETYARKKKIDVFFTGRLTYDKMCSLLNICDIAVNPIVKGSAATIINKHADYAASGLPVLNTQENFEYRNLVEEYSMGFNCENGNADDLAEKLMELMDNERLRHMMGMNARRCAEERFDRKSIYKKIINVFGDSINI